MKKGIGIAVVFLGCVISAVDVSRMFNGLAYGWSSILVGLLIALAGWLEISSGIGSQFASECSKGCWVHCRYHRNSAAYQWE